MKPKKRLGEILVEKELITEDQLEEGLALHRQTGQKLGVVLIEQDWITESDMFKVLEEQFDIPFVNINNIFIDPKVPKLISELLARKYHVLPIQLEKNKLTVAMSDPLDFIAKDDIRLATGFDVLEVMSSSADITKAINKYYDASDKAKKAVEEFSSQHQSIEEKEEDAEVTNAPMVRLVNGIIAQAVRSKASDIHIEPFEKYVRIRQRVDGDLVEVMSTEKNTHAAIVTRIKIMGNMNISEKRIPQDGRIETVIEGLEIDMRISVLPTVYGEKVVIRLLDRSGLVVRKEDLGFTAHNLELINRIMKVPEGIILVTGPTGSGKTTTLYSFLKELNQPHKNIITVEDPVEYRLDGINQVQVNNKAGLTFASGLRSILRQDPDIVMVGEIRDVETAEIAIRAAITGHVVLSTIHTNDTVSTISRLGDMGIQNFLISSAVVGIIAQRLVKKICANCSEPHEASTEEKFMLQLPLEESFLLYKGSGCNACNNSGYSGRTAIHEVLPMERSLQNKVSRGESMEVIRKQALDNGLKTLNQTCKELVIQGVTTIEEMIRMTYNLEEVEPV